MCSSASNAVSPSSMPGVWLEYVLLERLDVCSSARTHCSFFLPISVTFRKKAEHVVEVSLRTSNLAPKPLVFGPVERNNKYTVRSPSCHPHTAEQISLPNMIPKTMC
ncbi:hypothetical protein CDAR_316591 [Caerostris darwini]|uniref:Uncharacterized protein n=1 Tax=Caerostris darwini TaxID=1538125 RepID=A0AAV4UJG7_9ARAC|nr:hypothetical protein CDAR_316591 [Caerostris darwini]